MSAHEGLSDERREELTDALVMSPLSDYIGTDLTPVVRTSAALAPLIARWLAEERAGECRRLAARACRNAEGRTGADADWWNRTAAWLMGHAATADREATR